MTASKASRDFWGENVQHRARIGNDPRPLFFGGVERCEESRRLKSNAFEDWC